MSWRAIYRQMVLDARDHVDLDLNHLDPGEMRERFPTITRELAELGLDLATDLIPVAPAAHHFIGGSAASTGGPQACPGCWRSAKRRQRASTAKTASRPIRCLRVSSLAWPGRIDWRESGRGSRQNPVLNRFRLCQLQVPHAPGTRSRLCERSFNAR
jgi:hypothetical protein